MNLDKIEEYLKKEVFPDLEKSRGGFDRLHTEEVVDWLKKIIVHNPELKLDEAVLIIAAYAHDWGYSDIFKDEDIIDFESIGKAKPKHMEVGAKKIAKLLQDPFFSFLTNKRKERCVHLVSVHDRKFDLGDADELVLMEADTLSGIDIDTEKPKRDLEFHKKLIKHLLEERIPRFITEYSKIEAERLIKRRCEYFEEG